MMALVAKVTVGAFYAYALDGPTTNLTVELLMTVTGGSRMPQPCTCVTLALSIWEWSQLYWVGTAGGIGLEEVGVSLPMLNLVLTTRQPKYNMYPATAWHTSERKFE